VYCSYLVRAISKGYVIVITEAPAMPAEDRFCNINCQLCEIIGRNMEYGERRKKRDQSSSERVKGN
jgi:hypothetical protein